MFVFQTGADRDASGIEWLNGDVVLILNPTPPTYYRYVQGSWEEIVNTDPFFDPDSPFKGIFATYEDLEAAWLGGLISPLEPGNYAIVEQPEWLQYTFIHNALGVGM